jgi:hypothetical protein
MLGINNDEYINGYYLMTIEDIEFISEEGINMILIEYENEFRDEILNYLTGEVMPDIKSDSMYLGLQILNDIRMGAIEHLSYCEDSNYRTTMNKLKTYTEIKTVRQTKKQKMKNSQRH